MNRRLVIIGVVVMLVIAGIVAGVLAIVFTREGVVIKSGFLSNVSSFVKNDTWITSARKINGHCRVDKTLDSDNLLALRANSTNSVGKVFLKLIQGDVEKTIDITGEFNDEIDMDEFKPGRIRMRLEFEDAETVNVVVSW